MSTDAGARRSKSRNSTSASGDSNEFTRILQDEVKSLVETVRRLKKQLKEKDEKILSLEEEIGWMDDKKLKKMRAEKKNQEDAEKRKRDEEWRKLEEEKARNIPEHVFWTFFSKFSGFNRFYLLNDEWHAANPTAADQLFGFTSWDEAKETVREKFPTLEMSTPQIYKVQKKKGDLYLELRDCSDFEQCFAVKMMDRTGLSAKRTGLLYGRDYRTIVRWRRKWMKKWGLRSRRRCDDDDDKEESSSLSQSRQMVNTENRKRQRTDDDNSQEEEEYISDESEPDSAPDTDPATVPAPMAVAGAHANTVAGSFTIAGAPQVPAAAAGSGSYSYAAASQQAPMTAPFNRGAPHMTAPPPGIAAEEPSPLPNGYDYFGYPTDPKRTFIRGFFH